MIKNANIVIMGKTGAGKSTIVNQILGYNAAQTGFGHSITNENQVYHTFKSLTPDMDANLILCDTVGLEIDSDITQKTLVEIQEKIKLLSNFSDSNISESDVNIVWYCINSNNNRFEEFEADLIFDLMYKYEIPFIIVLTQSWDIQHTQKFKEEILNEYHNFPINMILASDYETDAGTINAFGLTELLIKSIYDYSTFKINVLKSKLSDMSGDIQNKKNEANKNIAKKKRLADDIIEKKAKAAFVVGCIPGASIVSIQSQYISMLHEINKIFNIKIGDEIEDVAAMFIVTGLFTPVFAVPGISGYLAKEMIIDKGNEYLDSVISVIKKSSEESLSNSEIIIERLKEEINLRERG